MSGADDSHLKLARREAVAPARTLTGRFYVPGIPVRRRNSRA